MIVLYIGYHIDYAGDVWESELHDPVQLLQDLLLQFLSNLLPEFCPMYLLEFVQFLGRDLFEVPADQCLPVAVEAWGRAQAVWAGECNRSFSRDAATWRDAVRELVRGYRNSSAPLAMSWFSHY